MQGLGSTGLFNLIKWLCVLVTHFPPETQGLKGEQIYGQKLGWIVSTQKKSYNLLVTKYFRQHTYQLYMFFSYIKNNIQHKNSFQPN